MGYFSVNYQGLGSVIDAENRIQNLLSDACTELMAVYADVSSQPTLMGKGYSGKIRNVYNQTSEIQIDIYRMSQGMKKVYDSYMEYENKVLSNAEEVLTVKNGFSKSAVNVIGKAAKQQEMLVKEEKQIDHSLGSILYGATVATWAANWKQTGNILSKVKDYQRNGGKNLIENGYDWMKENGAPPMLIGAAKKLVGKVDGTVSDYEDVLQAIFNITDPDAAKTGLVAAASMIGIDMDAVEPVLDLLSPDSYLMTRQHELENRTAQAIRDGNYAEAAVTFAGSGIETLGKGSVDAGCRWISAGIDSNMGKVTEFFTGERITLSSTWDFVEDSVGINPGKVFNHVTADIGDGISSALDSFANWLGGH